ncbi:MAG: hypothetical protein V4506_13990 [Bacteroidota bacterium]
MKKLQTLIILFTICKAGLFAQTNSIINFDFNASSSYPVTPIFTETGITCSGTSTEAFQTYSGVATTAGAFLQNTTAGNAQAMANSSGTNTRNFVFQLGGSDLNTYQSYKLYFQAQRSSTGASVITVAYSTNGTSYTNLATTYNVTTSFSDIAVDLSAISAINASSSVYIKLMASGASSTGTLRIDNFEVQATKIISGGGTGTGNGWTLNGANVTTPYNVGIGTTNPAFPLDIVGNTNIAGNLTSSGSVAAANLSLSSLTGTGNRSLFVNSTGVVFAGTASTASSPNSCIPGAPQWSIGGDNISSLGLSDKSLGTCDNNDFVLKANNTQRVWIKPNGSIGINTANPYANLHVFPAVLDTNYSVMRVVAQNGQVTVNGKGGLELFTSTLNVGKTFSIKSEDDNSGIQSEIFSTAIEGQTKLYCYNTTIAKPAFSVQGIDLTADAQDRLGTTFKIYGNQNGDVSSSRDMSLYYKGSSGGKFLIYDGVPSDGGLNGIGVNATAKFGINGMLTSMTDHVEIGNPSVFGNQASNSTLKINNASPKAISVFPKTGTTIASAEVFVVFADGTVGIGTPLTNNPYNYKLAVNGTIGCKAFKVEINSTAWSDFVFDKEYKLMPLKELETYINKNKHLPNIPSNAEVDANNGVDVVDVESKLLQKVEELTLYIIQQQKEIDELKKAITK